ncbi:nicotinamide riboside transporter PnuC [Sphingomonas sp. AOB5]|uniref:nicotinamide riboside transporter PnuC n=1 Tax=Sphingomonas sp. AOB5 TaxID=3034017 RepID=UPI0023F9771A|nr:nicotinamide riboside transporter PnuC [Sphingomonas sp. AOB5]MDF7776957.1 nicotinamide riboside transporter PnuC [Sphingomonas sp. AOB5]
MTPIELFAATLGLINVALVVRRSIWNYPFGLAMVALYGWVFLDAKLYSDALLQIFFFVVQFYGWWNWNRSRADAGEVLVSPLGTARFATWITGALVATACWGAVMHYWTDAHFPWWDGAIAMFSIAAQILQSRRNLESWILWIAVDLMAIPLFALKGLWPTAILYVVFLILSIIGLIEWRRAASKAA